MKTTISKWGNSLAVRIPKPIADDLHVSPGSEVQIELNGNTLEIQPIQHEYDLDEMLKQVNKNNLHAEVKTGNPVGKEIW
jgi:antitoxin MazE